MKIFEIEDPSSNLVLLLKNLIAQANSQGQTGEYTWQELGNYNQNIEGSPLSYDSFKTAYDANPELFQNIVHNYNADGIVLKTNEKKPKAGSGDGDSVSKMAKAATARRRG